MKSFDLAQLGVQELTNVEMTDIQGGGGSPLGNKIFGGLVGAGLAGDVIINPNTNVSPTVNAGNNVSILSPNFSSGCGC